MNHSIQLWPASRALLFAALALTATCGTAEAGGPLPGYDAVYGLGLGNCTEMCRPFGVLSFGVTTLGDGNVISVCECMPGLGLDVEEDDTQEEADEEDAPEENGEPMKTLEPIRLPQPSAAYDPMKIAAVPRVVRVMKNPGREESIRNPGIPEEQIIRKPGRNTHQP